MNIARLLNWSAFPVMGVLLAEIGFSFRTWPFWAITGLLCLVDFTSAHCAWDRGWESAKKVYEKK